jgi:signal transduction histidine kinase
MASFLLTPFSSFIVAGGIGLLFVVIALVMDFSSNFFIGPLGLFAIALVSWLSSRSLENALKQLRIINQELDQRVAARTEELAEAYHILEDQARELARANLRLENQAAALSEANERLQSLDGLKSKFVSDVTHELRTPINNLTIYMEMLRAGKADKQGRFMDVLQEETNRLAQLVQDVLDLSRMELGTTKVEFGWISVNTLVDQVVTANQLQAESKGVALIFEPLENLPPIWADANQLNQILNNLIGNAVNYTDDGKVQVYTSYEMSSGMVCLQVEDTGMGIDPDDIPHVFDRFYRGQQASQSAIRGTGLGLAITKEIVEAHHGTIEVESQVGAGTTFTVRLPVTEPEDI